MNYTRLKYACYTTNISMSVVANLSPLLFITFRLLYGISYSLLGLMVLVYFCMQLLVDLIFSFYSYKFNINLTVKLMPVLTVIGLVIYAVFPFLFPSSVYIGLIIGTVIFAASSGLAEVLISPLIAAIPSENPDREMSKLHSTYAWGVVFVVILSTLFLFLFKTHSWQWLALFWTIIPLFAALLFFKCDIPKMQTLENAGSTLNLFKNKAFLLCILCIFFGGASECIMAQWSSSYLEQALGISKVVGDILGVALFAVMLGTGRTLFSKYGKNVARVLFVGSLTATFCYLTAAIVNNSVVGLIACALTGLCTSMLWPGSLIIATNKFPKAGVAIYALMAAGGDLGASVGPQLVGVVTDISIKSQQIAVFAANMGITSEQLGMKIGMLAATIFPIAATIITAIILRRKKNDLALPVK